MTSFVKDTFRSVLVERIAMTLMSKRGDDIVLLFGQLGETELYTYFVPQGVEALKDIVFSSPGVTDIVFGLSSAYRLELALNDQPSKLEVIYDAINEKMFNDSAKASPIKQRIGPSEFYEAKESTPQARKDLLLSYEWLFVCVMLRADLALYASLYADAVSRTSPETPGEKAPSSKG